MPQQNLSSSTIINLNDQHVRRTDGDQVIHRDGNSVSFDHRLNGNPAWFFELGDCRRALTRRDAADMAEAGTVDVVCAKDVALGGWEIFFFN